ncbi:MAG: RsmE family RNA methyltransferase [Candidatus Zixiibacteriota bacterium]
MNLVILTNQDRVGKDRYVLTDHRATHIREVLKGHAGATVEVGLVDGPVGTAAIELTDDRQVVLSCSDWCEAPIPRLTVDLVCAIPRPKTLRKVLILAATMGVRCVHFVRANRTEKSYLQSPWLNPEQQLPFLLIGLSQGRQTRLPEVNVWPLFRPFVEDTFPDRENREGVLSVKLLCDPGSDIRLTDLDINWCGVRFVVAIGPEGGWVPFETGLLEKAGFQRFSIGPWTLRVETAVAAALAQLGLVSGKDK